MNLNPVACALACLLLVGTECPDQLSLPSDEFGSYWYQGKAEITSYRLQQARYGEIRDGHAVLIFVTEDFSRAKHVKLDDYENAGADRQTVLKLNLTKKFTTGIYPYSLMTSVFMPVESGGGPSVVKVTTSAQEWCGHTFLQLNLRDGRYIGSGFSYFESEGDREFSLPLTYLEDEIWTRIRLDPESLPTGELQMIPGTLFQRLRHVDESPETVIADRSSDGVAATYRLVYPSLERTLTIKFDETFPHGILEWSETEWSGLGDNRRELTTTAVRDTTIMSDYWNRNRLEDESLRAVLGLE